jgi:hypothetical protein
MNYDDMNTLILPSEDGQEYVLAILYPSGWSGGGNQKSD